MTRVVSGDCPPDTLTRATRNLTPGPNPNLESDEDRMMTSDKGTPTPYANTTPRKPWTAPVVLELPRLTELTLQSFIPGTGIPGGGGSTVF